MTGIAIANSKKILLAMASTVGCKLLQLQLQKHL